MNFSLGVALFVLSALVAAVSQLLLKKSALKPHDRWYKAYLNPLVMSAYALLFSAALINIQGFVWVPYKTGMIVITSSYVFVLLLSRFILNEKITRPKLLGMLLIMLGIIVFVLG
jgi:drug/metabolite transporter (DMT)-like permease